MKPVFKNGRALSPNAAAALKYVAKVGVMSKELWAECFCKSKKRWRNRQLEILLENNLLRLHSCGLGDFYVLGDRGIEMAIDMKWPIVSPALPRQLRHDEIVGQGLLKLQGSSICKNWRTEKEMKSSTDNAFLVKDQGGQTKYPDSIFEAYMAGKFYSVALEYERNGKTVPRYRSILWSYNKMRKLSMVLFIVENTTIKKRIKRALRYLGEVPLIEKIAFMNANEWIQNPAGATIELSSTRTTFEKLSQAA